METLQVLGKDIQVGDVLHTWWDNTTRGGDGCRDPIQRISVPYSGPLAYCWKHGAYFAYFMFNRTGMTIDNASYYTVDRP